MVRLRATGSVVPMALIREACRHQAELIVESKSMDCPALRTIPTLVPWAEALASTSLLSLVVQTFEFEALVDWDTWAVTRVVTERTAIDILRADCQFISPAVGGPGARVGCWFGGGGPPPPKIHLSDDRNLPPLLFKIPQRRRVLTHA